MIHFLHANRTPLVLSVHWNNSFALCLCHYETFPNSHVDTSWYYFLNKNVKSSVKIDPRVSGKTFYFYFLSFQVYKNYMSACEFLFFSGSLTCISICHLHLCPSIYHCPDLHKMMLRLLEIMPWSPFILFFCLAMILTCGSCWNTFHQLAVLYSAYYSNTFQFFCDIPPL